MRCAWQTKKLDDLCNIARGGSPRPIKQFLTDDPEGVNWIKISDATASSKYIFETKQKIKPEGIKRSRMVHEGDFILSNSMSFGRPYIMRTTGCIHDGWLVLEGISADIDQDFLFHFLGSGAAYKQFDERAAGSTVRNLNIDLVRSVTVPIPPISEQKRIVAILDEAFAGIDTAIANTEKNLANARELFESYLSSVFTNNESSWHKYKLESICKKITVGHVGSMANRYRAKGIPLLRSQNIRPFHVDLDKVVFIDEEFHGELKKSALKPGDLGIVRTGYPGTAAVIPDSLAVANCSDLVIVRPGDQVFSEFLAMVFNSYYGKQAVAGVLVGAAQKHFNVTAAKAALIPLPSLEEQKRFIAECGYIRAECQRLESIYQQKLTALTELKQSLLQKAFSGELTAGNVIPITSVKKSSAAPNTDSPAFAAHIMAVAYHWHESGGKNKTFGHVKAQKTLHLVEALAQIDLGRIPVKDAAGPNDFAHMRTAETWAKDNDYYEFVQRPMGKRGYDFVKGKRYNEWLAQALEAVEPYKTALDRVVKLLMPLDTQKAELVATVYAAWNNLLLDGHTPTEAAIVQEARDNWHPDKQQYTRSQFHEAIDRLRSHGMVPTGTGKRVTGQQSLEL